MKVLISPGYGAGWSTWNFEDMAYDTDLIEAFEDGIESKDMYDLCMQKGYIDNYGAGPYMGGFKDLQVREIPSGTKFKIKEYDGYESIEFLDLSEWKVAK